MRGDNVLIVLVRHGSLVEEGVVLTDIERIRCSIAVDGYTRERIFIHRYGRGRPVERHAAFLLSYSCTLAGGKRGDGSRLVVVQARTMNGYRLQLIIIHYTQVAARLVDACRIADMCTCNVGHIGIACHPTAILQTANAVLRDNNLVDRFRLRNRTLQYQTSCAIPHTAT